MLSYTQAEEKRVRKMSDLKFYLQASFSILDKNSTFETNSPISPCIVHLGKHE